MPNGGPALSSLGDSVSTSLENTHVSIQAVANRLLANVEKVIIGKTSEVQLTLVGLLCQGHLLIEDVPGVGKTMLAKALARSIGTTFNRIQFTPDMLPSDVTGVSIFNQQTRQFEFRAGPIMAQIVLADEINRATPKTQAAMLEAMEEKQTTVDGVTHQLPRHGGVDRSHPRGNCAQCDHHHGYRFFLCARVGSG